MGTGRNASTLAAVALSNDGSFLATGSLAGFIIVAVYDSHDASYLPVHRLERGVGGRAHRKGGRRVRRRAERLLGDAPPRRQAAEAGAASEGPPGLGSARSGSAGSGRSARAEAKGKSKPERENVVLVLGMGVGMMGIRVPAEFPCMRQRAALRDLA